jgi:hypothetical protein
MSQENVEVVRRYLEHPPAETVPLEGVIEWMAGFWESDGDYYGSQVPGSEALPRARGGRAIRHRVPRGLALPIRGRGRDGDCR